MDEATGTSPVDAARERVHATLQRLWEKAGVRSAYVKSEWVELDAAIEELSEVSAADATEWMRNAIAEILDDLPYLLRDLAEVARTVALKAEADKAEERAGQAEVLLQRLQEVAAE